MTDLVTIVLLAPDAQLAVIEFRGKRFDFAKAWNMPGRVLTSLSEALVYAVESPHHDDFGISSSLSSPGELPGMAVNCGSIQF